VTTVLTIAGSDSSAGAGIQADLKTFAALGAYGVCAVTSITAQATSGLTAALALAADLVTAQIEAVAGDMEIHAVKTGMLADAAIVEAVAAAIQELDLPLLVVDPVIASSSGYRLLDEDGVQMLRTELFPLARVVTPNLPEAEALSGRRVRTGDDARDAARRIHDLGPAAVVITGGHSQGSVTGEQGSGQGGAEVVDLLYDGHAFTELRVPRVNGIEAHGTGCTYASAVAAYLALGRSLEEAAAGAQRYVAGAIEHARPMGRGRALLGHFWGGILKA
jgi:hydroxymethylpyrimidine/phosphomethylpyrimidine kinase